MMEYERRFKIDNMPAEVLMEVMKESPIKISQQYILYGKEGHVRIRRSRGEFSMTMKCGHGDTREEIEIPIDYSLYNKMSDLPHPSSDTMLELDKERYYIEVNIGANVVEVCLDFYFFNSIYGVIAEVEFETKELMDKFQPPYWFGEEVTDTLSSLDLWKKLNGLDDRRE